MRRHEHYKAAEGYLDMVGKLADAFTPGFTADIASVLIAKAQVHATLAAAMAEVEQQAIIQEGRETA